MAAIPDPHTPTFFIAGAPKAGTTSLYYHLCQHPQIFMCPLKEPSYFSLETRLENFCPDLQAYLRRQIAANKIIRHGSSGPRNAPAFINSWEEYIALFREAGGAKAVGEASVFYLWSPTAARGIASANPRAKVILVLRHPAERAFSQYLHVVSNGLVSHSFRRFIAEGLRANPANINLYHPFLDIGMYSAQVERFFACLPREQVRIWLYEDTLKDPAGFLRQVLTFLDVDPAFVPDTSRRFHRMEIPRALPLSQPLRRSSAFRALRSLVPAPLRPVLKRPLYRKPGSVKIDPEDRRFLTEYYRDDIQRLQRVIERDLTHWLQ